MVALVVWSFAVLSSVAALIWAYRFYHQMMLADEGTLLMQEIAESVRIGANAYLWQQYKWVTIVFVLIASLLALASFGLNMLSVYTPFAFLTGGFFSGLCGWFGMKTATRASNRTAAAARHSLNEGLTIAFRSGAVMGLTVVGLGLLYICLWFAVLYWIVPLVGDESSVLSLSQISVTMLSFGMGASAQALFARVGGGIFTKAADVGADLVGKVERSLKEDSPRNPATIADNVGDNVGDVAGMGADLYESYCGSILAASALGVAAFSSPVIASQLEHPIDAQLRSLLLPIAIAAIGILSSIAGVYLVKTSEERSQRLLLKALSRGIHLSSVLVIVASVVLVYVLMPRPEQSMLFGFFPGIVLSILVGLVSGLAIGKWTEYATSDEYAPTKSLAQQAETGAATIIINGVADGMLSTWFPVVVVCVTMLAAFGFANGGNFDDPQLFALGLYGVGIAAVGMLSTLGITLATDAYGPIADNAGGNAEMAGLEPIVRERTDALDSLGNTTAATGKGFAIGSAALTALALLAAYVEGVRDGMQRWGDDFVQASSPPDGIHRLASDLIVSKNGTTADVFMLIRESSEKQDEFKRWVETKDSAIDGGLVRLPSGSQRGQVESIGAAVVSVKDATLRDFLHYYDVTLLNPRVMIGVFLGSMSSFVFCAMTMKSVGRAAQAMVIEVRRQFRESPGILDGTVKPDFQRPVEISTKAAQREMVLPSLLGLCLPIVVGIMLGVAGVLGLLTGCLTSGFCLAVFMANSGGAWDNAKKHIEAGNFGGKGSEAHKAAVVGDTVGDPFKDTSGPSLNILIKLMSIVSVVIAGLVVRYSFVAIGLF